MSTLEPLSGFKHGTPGLGIQRLIHKTIAPYNPHQAPSSLPPTFLKLLVGVSTPPTPSPLSRKGEIIYSNPPHLPCHQEHKNTNLLPPQFCWVIQTSDHLTKCYMIEVIEYQDLYRKSLIKKEKVEDFENLQYRNNFQTNRQK